MVRVRYARPYLRPIWFSWQMATNLGTISYYQRTARPHELKFLVIDNFKLLTVLVSDLVATLMALLLVFFFFFFSIEGENQCNGTYVGSQCTCCTSYWCQVCKGYRLEYSWYWRTEILGNKHALLRFFVLQNPTYHLLNVAPQIFSSINLKKHPVLVI